MVPAGGGQVGTVPWRKGKLPRLSERRSYALQPNASEVLALICYSRGSRHVDNCPMSVHITISDMRLVICSGFLLDQDATEAPP